MTSYALVQSVPDGEVYAVRYNDDNEVDGLCGPLHYTEQDAPLDEYHYDDEHDAIPPEVYRVLRTPGGEG